MDRINGADWADIGGGNRGFKDENVVAGTAGTAVTAAHLNAIQEEILKVVEAAGLVPDVNDWTQLYQAMGLIARLKGALAITASMVFDPAALGIPVVNQVIGLLWGAGGGGASIAGGDGASGAGGGFALKILSNATLQNITIGQGGLGDNIGGNGAAGGTTSWGGIFSANGGTGGGPGPGPGGAGINGDVNIQGSGGGDLRPSGPNWVAGGTAPFMGGGGLIGQPGSLIGSGGAAINSGGSTQSDDGQPGFALAFW